MGEFYPLMALEAELQHVRQQKKYLERLAAKGPEGIRQEIEHWGGREARLMEEIRDEQQMFQERDDMDEDED